MDFGFVLNGKYQEQTHFAVYRKHNQLYIYSVISQSWLGHISTSIQKVILDAIHPNTRVVHMIYTAGMLAQTVVICTSILDIYSRDISGDCSNMYI